MTGAILQFLLAAVVIGIAAVYLTKYADAIAELTGFGRLLIGSILLAGATSLPELSVDISAIRLGAADLAVGDLMGSCLFNLLILAFLDMSFYSRGAMLSRSAAGHALSGTFSALMITAATLGILTAKSLEAYTLFGLSPSVIALGVIYLFGIRLIFVDQKMSAAIALQETPEPAPANPGRHFWMWSVGGFIGCAAIIVAVAPYLAHAAEEVAAASGLGRTFIGTTLVALSTSLPELVSMFAAIRMRAFDLAIGNVFGSNAFNMLLLLPLDAVADGSLPAMVSQRHALTGAAAVLATQIAVLGQLYQVESRRRFIEPDAVILMVVVFGALAMIYYLPA